MGLARLRGLRVTMDQWETRGHLPQANPKSSINEGRAPSSGRENIPQVVPPIPEKLREACRKAKGVVEPGGEPAEAGELSLP